MMHMRKGENLQCDPKICDPFFVKLEMKEKSVYKFTKVTFYFDYSLYNRYCIKYAKLWKTCTLLAQIIIH